MRACVRACVVTDHANFGGLLSILSRTTFCNTPTVVRLHVAALLAVAVSGTATSVALRVAGGLRVSCCGGGCCCGGGGGGEIANNKLESFCVRVRLQ